jgi:hypothetical protein
MPPIDSQQATTTKPDGSAEKHVEKSTKPANPAGETLSQQATKPGDKEALAAVHQPAGEVPHDFGTAPKIVSTDTPAHLSETDLKQRSTDLHAALDKRSWGMSSPDAEAVKRILEAVKDPADLKRLQDIYQTQAGADGNKVPLQQDLQSHLSDYDFRKSEALLNSTGNRTNDAGNLMAAISLSKSDFARGNAEIRATLSTLSAADLTKLDADFRKAYNHGYKEELDNSAHLSPQTKKALETLEKGSDVWQHDKTAIKDLATTAIESGDKRMFTEATRLNTPEAELARRELASSPEVRDKLVQKFPSDSYSQAASQAPEVAALIDWKQKIDPAVVDYLTEGHNSLKTLIEQNTNQGLFTNKDNLELDIRNATSRERAMFIAGQDKNNGSPEAQQYYQKVHNAFVAGGSPREVAVGEDELRNGKSSIIGDMAKTHTDGLFGGHNQNELLTKAENLSKEDWQKLRSAEGETFRTQIKDSLDTYATPKERDRIMDMLNEKANKDTYEEANKVRRDFDTVVTDAQSTSKLASALRLGTNSGTKAVLQRLSQLTPDEAAKYKDDPAFKTGVDKFVGGLSDPSEKLLGQNLLKKIDDTGKPAQLDDVDKLLQATIERRPVAETTALAEAALQDKSLRDRLAKPDGELSPEDKTIKSAISGSIDREVRRLLGTGAEAAPGFTEQYMKELLTNGRFSSSSKFELELPKKDMIATMMTEPAADRQQGMKRLTEQEQQVVQNALKSPDKQPDLADRMRTFAIGSDNDYQQFQKELQSMSFTDRQKLRDEYAGKYKVDLDADFVGKVPQKDQGEYQSLLASAPSDGRQTFYDRFHQLLQSDSGVTSDGTQATAERANTQMQNALSEYQRISKTLPADQQQALDKYYSQALDQQKESKQKLAEIAADAVITASALAAAPLTGGVSVAAVASIAAAAGAVARPALLKAMEGKDFDGSVDNILRQSGIGAFSATLNFIGAEAFAGAGKLAVTAGAKLADGAVVAAGDAALASTEQQALRSGMTKLCAKYGDASTPMTQTQTAAFQQDLAKTIEQAAPNAPQSVRDELAKSVTGNFEKTVAQEQKAISDDLAQRTVAQIARDRAQYILQNGAVGGIGGAASEIVIPTLAGGQVDWNSVGRGALAGFGAGTVIGAVIHAPGMAKDYHVNLRSGQPGEGTAPGQSEAPVSLRSNDQTTDVTVRQNNGKLVQLKPGDNQEYVLKTGDEIVAAATVTAAAKIKAPANDNMTPLGQPANDNHAPIPEDVRQPIRVGERPGINAVGTVIKTETPAPLAGNGVRPPSASLEQYILAPPPQTAGFVSGSTNIAPGGARIAPGGSVEGQALKSAIPTGEHPSNVVPFERPRDTTPQPTAEEVKARLRDLSATPRTDSDKKYLDQLTAIACPESLTRLQQQGTITADQAVALQRVAETRLKAYERFPTDEKRISNVRDFMHEIKWMQDNAGSKNTKAYADLVMTNQEHPELNIPLKQLRTADSQTLDFYNGRIKEASNIDPANELSPKGDRYEYAAQRLISDVLTRTKIEDPSLKDWVFVPGAKGSAGDHTGMDGIMLNLKDHRVVPVDIKSDPAVTAEAEKSGNKWAIDLGVQKDYAADGTFAKPPADLYMTNAIKEMLAKPAINGNSFTEFGGNVGFPPLSENADLKSTLSNFAEAVKGGDATGKSYDAALRYFGSRAEGAADYASAQKNAVGDITNRLISEMKVGPYNPAKPQFSKVHDATGNYLQIHIAAGTALRGKYGTASDMRIYEDGTVKLVPIAKGKEPISIGSVKDLLQAANNSNMPFQNMTNGKDLAGIDFSRNGNLSDAEAQKLFQQHPEYMYLGNAVERKGLLQAARSSDNTVTADQPRLQAIDPTLDDSAARLIAVERTKFTAEGLNLSDADMVKVYNDTKGFSSTARLDQAARVAKEMAEFKTILQKDFTYPEWQKVNDARSKFAEFGLRPSTEDLALLADASPDEVNAFRHSQLNSELAQFVQSKAGPNEQIPAWLQSIVEGKAGATEAVSHDSSERNQYRAILVAYYQSLKRGNPGLLADQVLGVL